MIKQNDKCKIKCFAGVYKVLALDGYGNATLENLETGEQKMVPCYGLEVVG